MRFEVGRLLEDTDAVVDRLYRTRPFQRQRYNLQLGFCDVPYPYESEPRVTQNYYNYSRISHLKGCYKLATDVIKRSGHADGHVGEAAIACYVHDIGHGQTSHAIEGILGFDHEKLGADIVRHGEIADIISDGGFDQNVVAKVFCDQLGHYSSFLTCDIGIDRLVYVKADSAAMEKDIDLYDIENYLYLDSDKFYLKGTELGLQESTVEWMFGQRSQLIACLYGLPANRSMTSMYRTAMTHGLEEGAVTLDDAVNLTLLQQYDRLAALRDARAKSVYGWLDRWHPFYGVKFDLDGDKADELRKMRTSDERLGVEAEIERRVGRELKRDCTSLIDVSRLPGRSKLDFSMEVGDSLGELELVPAKKAIHTTFEYEIDLSRREFWTFFDPQTADALGGDDGTLKRHIAAVCGIDAKPEC